MQPHTVAIVALLGASLLIVPSGPAAGNVVPYVASGTAVVKEQGQAPFADDGVVVCGSSAPGIGGGCLPFGADDSVEVLDAAMGHHVAFQVCIDNNGDGRCSAGREGERCADRVFFSHDDEGNFYNPLGPLPTGFDPGCAGGPFHGYVVFLCTGAHVLFDDGTALPIAGATHAHAATSGTIQGATGGTGYGNFCRPANNQVKTYIVT
jgi:hypothetical protein